MITKSQSCELTVEFEIICNDTKQVFVGFLENLITIQEIKFQWIHQMEPPLHSLAFHALNFNLHYACVQWDEVS